jgi:hypothetical protein
MTGTGIATTRERQDGADGLQRRAADTARGSRSKPRELASSGRLPVAEMPADMKDAYDFTMKLRGLVPRPHKIWLDAQDQYP